MLKTWKPRYDLILLSTTDSLAETFGKGCVIHSGEQDPWPPDYGFEVNLDHAIAHLQKVKEGENIDEQGFSHIENAFARLSFCVDEDRKSHNLRRKHGED